MGSRSTRRGLIAPVLVVCFVIAAGGAQAGAAACSETSVELRSGDAVARFNVDIADSGAERAQGLMNRDTMPASSGMLFIYESPRRASFWMKNTLIPLDMIFADAAGRVTQVHPMAKPLDETPIDGGEGVTFVLEIKGGLSERLGIKAGSELRHPAVEQAIAAWPCSGK